MLVPRGICHSSPIIQGRRTHSWHSINRRGLTVTCVHAQMVLYTCMHHTHRHVSARCPLHTCTYYCPGVCMFARARWQCTLTPAGMEGDMGINSEGWVSSHQGGDTAAGSGGVPAWAHLPGVCMSQAQGTARVWVALTAGWHSSQAGCAEWPPSSACRRGSRRGRSQNSGSAAPAAPTPAPRASVSPAGPRVGPAAASGAPVPAGSRSGPGLGFDGCPATLQRDTDSLSVGQLPCRAQSLFSPPSPRPSPARTFQKSECLPSTRETEGPRRQWGEAGESVVWAPHRAHVQTLELSSWVARGNC